jgi:trafficking protein particle complex subunit 11
MCNPLISRRANSKSPKDQFTVTRIILPELHPPDFGLSVIINPPTAVELHKPFILNVSIRNHDSSRSAELSFTIEQADGFVAAGIRAGVLPLLLPGTGEKLSFQLIPISVGLVKLPVFKIQRIIKEDSAPTERTESGASLDNRPGEAVPVVDQRWDSVDAKGSNVHFYTREGEALSEIDLSSWLSVLVVTQ